MSFFSRLFAKLFGKKKEEAPRVPYTPTITPPYVTTGKFQPPEVTVPEHPRVRAITEELPTKPVVQTGVDGPPPASKLAGWPQGTYLFGPMEAKYVPVKLPGRGWENAGPFNDPKEFDQWVADVMQRDKNMRESDRLGLWKVDGRGSLPVTEASVDDLCYVWHKQHDYRLKYHNGDLFREVFSGKHDDIARAIQTGDINNPSMGAWPLDKVRDIVMNAVTIAFLSNENLN